MSSKIYCVYLCRIRNLCTRIVHGSGFDNWLSVLPILPILESWLNGGTEEREEPAELEYVPVKHGTQTVDKEPPPVPSPTRPASHTDGLLLMSCRLFMHAVIIKSWGVKPSAACEIPKS